MPQHIRISILQLLGSSTHLCIERLRQSAESLLAFTQCFFVLLLLRDVIVRFENAPLIPAAFSIKRPMAGNYDLATVLTPVNELTGPSFMIAKLFHNAIQRLRKLGVKQLMGNAAQYFLAAIAIQFGRAFVPIGNAISLVANHDCVVAQVEQARSFRQHLLSPLPSRDVPRYLRRSDHAARTIPQGRYCQ